MSAADEARAEAERRWPEWRHLRDSWDAVAMQAAFGMGAQWQASRPITDEQVSAAGRVMYEGWDRWLDDDPQAFGERELMRTALEAAIEAAL